MAEEEEETSPPPSSPVHIGRNRGVKTSKSIVCRGILLSFGRLLINLIHPFTFSTRNVGNVTKGSHVSKFVSMVANSPFDPSPFRIGLIIEVYPSLIFVIDNNDNATNNNSNIEYTGYHVCIYLRKETRCF